MKFEQISNKRPNTVSIDLSRNFLITLFNSLFSENTMIDRKFLTKVKNFFEMLDLEEYSSNKDKTVLLDWIGIYLEKFFVKGIQRSTHIFEELLTSTMYREELLQYIDSEEAEEVSNEDINYIEGFITLRLKWSFIFKEGQQLKELLEKIEYNDYDSFENTIEDTFKIIEDLYYKNQLIRSRSEEGRNDFSFKNSNEIDTALERSYRNSVNPRNTIKTGLATLNKLLHGGFQAGRAYCILTLPGHWKSGFLLNAAMWALKYNQELVPNDPTKIPTVVMLSLENSANETIERIASYLSDEPIGVDFRKTEFVDLKKSVLESEIYNSKLDFVFVYRKSNTINMNDVEGIVLEIENTPIVDKHTGNIRFREVVFLIVDYLGRLIPISNRGEFFEQVGAVSNDIGNFAKIHQIPVLSAHQLNRDADKRLEGLDDNKLKGLKLGRQHVAGARAIIDNSDEVIIIYPEDVLIDNQRYLLINSLKRRGLRTLDTRHFYQPFENEMKLVEDIHYVKSVAVSDLEQLTSTDDLINLKKERRKKSLTENMSSIMKDDNNSDIFEEVE